jgi:hypothetical protein
MIILKLVLKCLEEGLVELEALVHLLPEWRVGGSYGSWWVQPWNLREQEEER